MIRIRLQNRADTDADPGGSGCVIRNNACNNTVNPDPYSLGFKSNLGTVKSRTFFPGETCIACIMRSMQVEMAPAVEAVRPPQPPQQILQSEADMSELITSDVIPDNLSLDDIVSQVRFRYLLTVHTI